MNEGTQCIVGMCESYLWMSNKWVFVTPSKAGIQPQANLFFLPLKILLNISRVIWLDIYLTAPKIFLKTAKLSLSYPPKMHTMFLKVALIFTTMCTWVNFDLFLVLLTAFSKNRYCYWAGPRSTGAQLLCYFKGVSSKSESSSQRAPLAIFSLLRRQTN